MTSVSFQIPIKPISLNTSHRIVRRGKRMMRIKTEATVLFEEEFSYHLSNYETLKSHIIDNYDPHIYSIQVEAFFYLNELEYFTKVKNGKKTISKRSMDLDNMIKVGFDQIFKWLGIDDSQVTRIIAEKIPTNEQPTMVFRISLVRFPQLFLVPPELI